MEELLNKLIEKGWKPRWIYTSIIGWYWLVRCEEYIWSPRNERKSYRELVSKESGLWQFCCRNKLVDWKPEWIKTCGWVVREENQPHNSYYRIIESALCDEDELEKFLLDNIKIS